MADKKNTENNETHDDKSRFVATMEDMKITTVEEMRANAAKKKAEEKKNS